MCVRQSHHLHTHELRWRKKQYNSRNSAESKVQVVCRHVVEIEHLPTKNLLNDKFILSRKESVVVSININSNKSNIISS